jgi:osmoprotectant transport system permease protein
MRYLMTTTLLLGLSFGGIANAKEVKVGSKKFTENVILGEMAKQLAVSTGAESKHVKELGGTRILWNALLAGELDVYPEYTGTITHEILAGQNIKGEEAMAAALAEYGIKMTKPLGFNNTYAMGMLETVAEKLGVKTISDLRNHPELKIGFTNEFMERKDGWPGLKKRYNLPQNDVQGLDHDLAYRGIQAGSIQMMDMYSTDADIEYYKMVVLEDDASYFPVYNAVFLYRDDLDPKIAATLKKVEGSINAKQMIALNAQAKIKKMPAEQVVSNYLNKLMGTNNKVVVRTRAEQLWGFTKAHLGLVFMSLVPAIFVAIGLGILSAKFRALGQVVMATVGIIQTIPSLAILVIMIPFLGIGAPPAIFALFLYSLLPIVRSTYQGLTEIPPNLQEAALALGLPAKERFWRIEFPLATRAIASGIKVAAVINIGFATLGALIGAGGYGQPILTGIRLDDMGLILMGAIPAALMAVAAQFSFEFIERMVGPKGLRVKV